jgi:hypothetical protein
VSVVAVIEIQSYCFGLAVPLPNTNLSCNCIASNIQVFVNVVYAQTVTGAKLVSVI